MDKPEIEHYYVDNLSDSFTKLCESHHLGKPTRVITDPFEKIDHRIASALVAFIGPEIKGSVVLSGSPKLFEISHPSYVPGGDSAQASERKTHDWVGEMANQLLGRFKNAVMRYDIDFGISPPTVVLANEVVFGLVGNTSRENLYFDVGDGMSAVIRLQLHCTARVNFEAPSEVENLVEGTALLF